MTGEEFDNRIYGVPSTAPATSTSSTATTATTATTAVADTTVVASTPSTPAIAADAVSSTRRTNGPLIALALLAAVGGLSLSGYVLVRRRQ